MARLSLKKSSKKWVLLFSLFVLLVFTLISINGDEQFDNSKSPVIKTSTDKPIEVAPKKETYNWQGKGEDPKYIQLPTISAEGFIQKADVDQNKQIAVPSNIHMAAWFIKSSRPGNPGLSIIDGHVDGRENAGIFKNLSKLEFGDVYSVELGDGSTKKFKVFKIDTVSVKESTNYLFSQDPAVASQLNLITCGGTFDPVTKSYDKRVIVSSAYIN